MKQAIKNAMLAGSSSFSFKQNIPKQYQTRQKQYYKYETRKFTEQMAQYSEDYVEAMIQGLDPNDPFGYRKVHIRLSSIVRSSSAISYEFDNYKMIDIKEPQYSYVRIGAKIITMGSTWLAINPDNMSNVLGKTIMQRCDAVWHFHDYYGNVCSEPMCFDRRLAKANDSDAQRATMITKGYFDAKIQYNKNTAQLFTNSRIILGTSAYHITGYSDFIQEFTGDYDSVNLLQFDLRYEEPNDAIDDMVNHVAGGKTFKWDINISGISTIRAGEETTLTAISTRTAEEHTAIAEDTPEHPIAYQWESSDESVAVIDAFGAVQGISEGKATITCYLEQNPLQRADFEITVSGENTDPHVSFTSTLPDKLGFMETVVVVANYYEHGEIVSGADIVYSFDGADKNAYTTSVNGNIATIKCWGGSVEPLRVSAECNDYGTAAFITLEGI